MASPKRYVGTAFPDGSTGTQTGIFSLGMPNKLGRLSVVGPDGKDHTLGLVETADVEMDNGFTLDPQCFSNWLEPNPGTPLWTLNCAKSIIRGASIPHIVRDMYSQGNSATFDFQWYSFLLAFDYNHAPPQIGAASYFNGSWGYHKVVIRNYRVTFGQGPNKRIMESFQAFGAGEEYSENGSQLWTSEKAAWGADFVAVSGISVPGSNTTVGTRGENSTPVSGTGGGGIG